MAPGKVILSMFIDVSGWHNSEPGRRSHPVPSRHSRESLR